MALSSPATLAVFMHFKAYLTTFPFSHLLSWRAILSAMFLKTPTDNFCILQFSTYKLLDRKCTALTLSRQEENYSFIRCSLEEMPSLLGLIRHFLTERPCRII